MKTFTALLALAAGSLAQNAFITAPAANSGVKAGQDITVQVTRPNSLTGSKEMSVAIGMRSCPKSPCLPAASALGEVLYNGPYKPEYHESYNSPYQNFTVTVPKDLQQGPVILGVAHATLIGAGPWPFLEVLNSTLVVV